MDEDSINNLEDEDLSNIIVLSDENGEDVQFEFLDLIEYDNHTAVLASVLDLLKTVKLKELRMVQAIFWQRKKLRESVTWRKQLMCLRLNQRLLRRFFLIANGIGGNG